MGNRFGIGTGSDPKKRSESTNTSELSEIGFGSFGSVSGHSDRINGFTLVEMLVSIGIFVIITTAVVVNYRAGEQSSQLRLGAETAASALRQVQTMAQAGRITDSQVPLGGYGVKIENDKIILFADKDNGHDFDSGEEIADQNFLLPQNVVIDAVATTLVTAVFEPADAEVWLNGGQTMKEAQVVLKHNKTGATRTIKIKRVSGRIEIL